MHGQLNGCYFPGSSRLQFRPTKFKVSSFIYLQITIMVTLTIIITEMEFDFVRVIKSISYIKYF